MENTLIYKSNIDILIEKILNEEIPDLIDIKYISNLFKIIKKNKIIPIEYYTKILIEIPKLIEKKCDIKICNRNALYIDEQKKYYCWIHCQTIS
jgi:hypothetical protein